MTQDPAIRPLDAADLPALAALIDATGLFPGEMLAGMAAPHLSGTEEAVWLVHGAAPEGLAYCVPERMTEGTWNLLLIAVHPDRQGQGAGTALVAAVERAIVARGARILLVETSGLPDFARTRAFYPRCGFAEEARIRDFYRADDDKVVFRKALAAQSDIRADGIIRPGFPLKKNQLPEQPMPGRRNRAAVPLDTTML